MHSISISWFFGEAGVCVEDMCVEDTTPDMSEMTTKTGPILQILTMHFCCLIRTMFHVDMLKTMLVLDDICHKEYMCDIGIGSLFHYFKLVFHIIINFLLRNLPFQEIYAFEN